MVDIGDKSEVSEDIYIPADESKLKEDQQKEYRELVERFKCECLKSYSVTRSGDVIKKFDLPFFLPLMETQCENKMVTLYPKLWLKLSSRVQRSWTTQCTTQ